MASLAGLGILSYQGLEDLVVVVAPAGDSLVVDMFMQFAPIGVALAVKPELLGQDHQHRILGRLGDLNMKLLVPLRISGPVLVASQGLDLEQLYDVLFGHLGRGKLGDVALQQLAGLEQLERARSQQGIIQGRGRLTLFFT